MSSETKEDIEINIEEESLESQEASTEETPDIELNTDNETEKSETISEESKLKETNDKYLRLHAEFDNYRRRTAKENLLLIESANNKLLEKLSEVAENFDRATAEENQSNTDDFLKGVLMIQTQFSGILKEFGLNEINPIGEKFDPNMHEALMQQPSEEVTEGSIITVFQKGFQVKNKVLKHAKVIVSAGQA